MAGTISERPFPGSARGRSLPGAIETSRLLRGVRVQPPTEAVSRRVVPAGTGAAVVAAGGRPGAAGAAEAGRPDVDGLTLWYDAPATDWESQALPIGNGT